MATQTHTQRKLIIRNKLQADAIARHYINEDKYMLMAPERMLYIARVLIYRCGSEYIDGLRKIIEVCSHGTGYMIYQSKMNKSIAT